MNDINFNENTSFHKENTLQKMYNRVVRESLNTNGETYEIRWETYNIILTELKGECNYNTYDEIRYRITGGENPNTVFFDIINRGDYSSPLIWLLKKRVEEYMEEDSFNRFFK